MQDKIPFPTKIKTGPVNQFIVHNHAEPRNDTEKPAEQDGWDHITVSLRESAKQTMADFVNNETDLPGVSAFYREAGEFYKHFYVVRHIMLHAKDHFLNTANSLSELLR